MMLRNDAKTPKDITWYCNKHNNEEVEHGPCFAVSNGSFIAAGEQHGVSCENLMHTVVIYREMTAYTPFAKSNGRYF